MKLNHIRITKNKKGFLSVELNGMQLQRVLNISYNKSSAQESTEVVIKLHVDELQEINIR